MRALIWSLAILALVLGLTSLTACASDPPPWAPATGHPWGVDGGAPISKA